MFDFLELCNNGLLEKISKLLTHQKNGYKKIIDRKGTSALWKVSEVFQKIPIEKMRFQVQKYEKYLKSKNDLKMSLGPFNKDI